MFFARILRFIKTRLRGALDWFALRILMLVEHEPSNDRVEFLLEPSPDRTIRVCLPKDQVRMQLSLPVLHRAASMERNQTY
jgi:hypothetical protein